MPATSFPAARLRPGDRAPDFALRSVDGAVVRLSDEVRGYPAVVVMFICNHCPYVRAYVSRLVALQAEFAAREPARRARLIGICSNDAETYPQDGFEGMKAQAGVWNLNFPYLRDEDQSIARAYGAQRTPEIFALDRDGICRYEGGVDDNFQDASKARSRPLRDALAALTEGRPVPVPQSYAIGCTIKWAR